FRNILKSAAILAVHIMPCERATRRGEQSPPRHNFARRKTPACQSNPLTGAINGSLVRGKVCTGHMVTGADILDLDLADDFDFFGKTELLNHKCVGAKRKGISILDAIGPTESDIAVAVRFYPPPKGRGSGSATRFDPIKVHICERAKAGAIDPGALSLCQFILIRP